jgi:hypothetical protein
MKIQGKEVPISPFKTFLPDETLKQMEYLKKKMELKGKYNEVIINAISFVYEMYKQKEDWLNDGVYRK